MSKESRSSAIAAVLLKNLVQLARGLQQIELGLLPLESSIEEGHPLFVFVQARLFDFAEADSAFVKTRLQLLQILLRQLQFKASNFLACVRFTDAARFAANIGADLV